MKAKNIVLGIVLFSSSDFALADTQKVDGEHLRAHRDFEKKNLEQPRFKTESELFNSVSVDPDEPTKDFRFRDRSGSLPERTDRSEHESGFAEFHLNQNGIPLQPHYPRKFKCEPSFSKSWKDYGKTIDMKEEIKADNGSTVPQPIFELGPYFRKETLDLNATGEWDSDPFLKSEENNYPPYAPSEGRKIEPPSPPPMIKIFSKENHTGDSP